VFRLGFGIVYNGTEENNNATGGLASSAATNTAFAGPWGISYTMNLTPDRNTGLGIWTEDMFVKAIRTGRHMGTSREIMPPMPWPSFRNATDEWIWHSPVVVTSKLSQKRKITVEEFAYSRARAARTVKVTLPSPLFIYSLWSPEQSTAAYRDPYEMFADVAAIIKAEAEAVAALGCTYIQIDAPDVGSMVVPENRELRERLGMPTERTLTEGMDIINSVADVPGVTFGFHVCKGNNMSQWMGSGGYDFTAEAVFDRLTNFDVFLLEYDDERSGSFEPLAKAPEDKQVILGLVSTKTTTLESVADLEARVHEAAKYTGLDRLGVSTQCGFSSTLPGANLTNEDVQERKLELVVELAHHIW